MRENRIAHLQKTIAHSHYLKNLLLIHKLNLVSTHVYMGIFGLGLNYFTSECENMTEFT